MAAKIKKIKPGQLVKGPGGKGLVRDALGQHCKRAEELEAALKRYPEGSPEAMALQQRLQEIADDARDLLEIQQGL